MKTHYPLTLLLVALTANACNGNDFAADAGTVQDYKIKIGETPDSQEPSGEPTADATPPEASSTTGDGDSGAECSKLTGLDSRRIKVAGSENEITLNKNEALMLNVTGNKNSVSLDLKNVEVNSEINAICIFVAGNQNQIRIDIANHVGAIYIKARGNQPKIDIATSAGSVIDKISMDAKGNKALFTVSGQGKYPCEKGGQYIICE